MIDLVALPPAEAIEYFRQKGFAIGFDHRDVWQEQHQAAFTVAKVMQQDILQDIRTEIDRALTDGTTLRDFQQRLMPALQAKGWWGRQFKDDPLTGDTKEVQLGSTRRLKVIYDTNLRTAHSEGQWQRIQDRKESFPYLEYDGNNSENPRLQHSAWDGLTLPVDDLFWQDHMPVKAYGCKCRVIPRTARQIERSGKPVSESPVVPKIPYVNARTGEVQQVPAGVNPSFYYRPGGRRAGLNQHLLDKLEAAPPASTQASVAELVSGPAFSDWYRKPAGSFPLAFLTRAISERMGAKTQLVSLSEQTLAKQLREHPEIVQEEYAQVQAAIDRGIEVPGNQPNTTVYVLDEADGYVSVVKVTRDGRQVFLTSLRRLSRDMAKRDEEVRRLLKKRK